MKKVRLKTYPLVHCIVKDPIEPGYTYFHRLGIDKFAAMEMDPDIETVVEERNAFLLTVQASMHNLTWWGVGSTSQRRV